MKYQLWGIFHGRPVRIFKNLIAEEASNWIVRFRASDEKHGYYLISEEIMKR